MIRALVILTLAACNQVFEIRATAPPPDAPPAPDHDGDGTPDTLDNCATANDQHDADEDGVGDVCDNCPLIANQDQESAGDPDMVGDLCDPHPTEAGDCLVLLDTFADPDAFAQHWQVATDNGMTAVPEPMPRAVRLVPPPATNVALLPRAPSGALFTGVFDTQLRARSRPIQGGLFAMSGILTPGTGQGCGIAREFFSGQVQAIARAAVPSVGAVESPGLLSAEPIDDKMILRLVSPAAADSRVQCRADHGLAVAAASVSLSSTQVTVGGAPGMLVYEEPVELDALALYRAQSTPCEPTIFR